MYNIFENFIVRYVTVTPTKSLEHALNKPCTVCMLYSLFKCILFSDFSLIEMISNNKTIQKL